ncbi:MAG TPA: UbiA family prenyltransferase, partial [bacterium]|nr:UbiA family prenyltransferase [bacterium]
MSVRVQTKTFFEMIRIEHSIFALPFAYLGLVFARETRWPVWAGVTVAMISFRTMGMAANRLIDRKIDAANPRTAGRALPSGKLKSSFVWQAAAISFLVFEISAFHL